MLILSVANGDSQDCVIAERVEIASIFVLPLFMWGPIYLSVRNGI
jgi:hypothetical protein